MMTPTRCPVIYVVQVCTGNKKKYFVLNPRIPRHPVILSDDEQGVSNHLFSIVFRFQYHSQKVSQDPREGFNFHFKKFL